MNHPAEYAQQSVLLLVRKCPVQHSGGEKQKVNIHKVQLFFSHSQSASVPAAHGIDCSALFHSTARARKGTTGTAASADTSQMTTKPTTLPLSTAAWR